MVMLTELLGFTVHDERGRRSPLEDLCVALLEDDYPPVTHLLVYHDLELRHLDWGEVKAVKPDQRRINVTDLSRAKKIEGDKDVLLRRDVLDALIIDLLGRRTTRVSDLLLEEEGGSLRIRAADAGVAAMIRRLTRGRVGRVNNATMFDWQYVEFLRGDPAAVDNGAGYRLRINRMPAGEIARLADMVPYLHAAELVKLLPDEKAADVLEAMSVERQQQVIEELPEEEAIELISLMSPDLATDLVGRLDLSMTKRFVARMPPRVRDRVIELLRYPENTVGGVMINDMISLPRHFTGEKAREEIRERLKETDFSSLVFVVDDEASFRLRGVLPLRDLLSMPDDELLEKVMDPYVGALDPMQPASEAAYRILDSGLAAMPVVRDGGRLIGAMTIDAAISQVVAPTSELRALRVFS
jgi:CBS domain-containing protein